MNCRVRYQQKDSVLSRKPHFDMIIYALVAVLCTWSDVAGFKVLWNVPTQQCKGHGVKFAPLLKQFSILVNPDDTFKGQVITIFYESQLGLYPHLGKNDEFINGGIPQLGDLKKHLQQVSADIAKDLPDVNSTGLRVIDWESWRPTWEFNWYPLNKYQEESKKLVRENFPADHESTVNKLAAAQWENASKNFMLSTINLAKQLRPNSPWCYYLFPDCYNYKGNSSEEFQCSERIQKGNNKLKWLWEASTAVCPSLYVYEGQLRDYDSRQRTWFTNGRLQEALRVAHPKALIFPYINYSVKLGMMVPEEELLRIMGQIASLGMDGAVVWGSSASVGSKRYCLDLENYVTDILGPAAQRVARNTARCSEEICHGRGKCTWPKDVAVIAWKFLIEKEEHDFYKDDIQCKCVEGYEGRYCGSTVAEK